jgi:hypothetical protein
VTEFLSQRAESAPVFTVDAALESGKTSAPLALPSQVSALNLASGSDGQFGTEADLDESGPLLCGRST